METPNTNPAAALSPMQILKIRNAVETLRAISPIAPADFQRFFANCIEDGVAIDEAIDRATNAAAFLNEAC